jgi:hypothetical protein
LCEVHAIQGRKLTFGRPLRGPQVTKRRFGRCG